jgi:tRNA pseudouridine65 synthase
MSRVSILACGEGWIAIDKPPGLSVHNAGAPTSPNSRIDGALKIPHETDAITLIADLLKQDETLRRKTQWDGRHSPSPCHRLDRETSGILLLAVDRKIASEFQQAFENHTTEKHYRAIVRGTFAQGRGEWTYPLSDRAEGRSRPEGAKSNQKPCRTLFQIERANRYFSELAIELHTGRQHQIRRHAVLSKHEVVGDRRYGDSRYNRRMEQLFGHSRLMLHAHRLKLTTPRQTIEISAPLPPEFDLLFIEKKEGPT